MQQQITREKHSFKSITFLTTFVFFLFLFFLNTQLEFIFYSSTIQGVFLSYSLSLMYNQKPNSLSVPTQLYRIQMCLCFQNNPLACSNLTAFIIQIISHPGHNKFLILCRNSDFEPHSIKTHLAKLSPFSPPLLPLFSCRLCLHFFLLSGRFLRNAAGVFEVCEKSCQQSQNISFHFFSFIPFPESISTV